MQVDRNSYVSINTSVHKIIYFILFYSILFYFILFYSFRVTTKNKSSSFYSQFLNHKNLQFDYISLYKSFLGSCRSYF